MTDPNFGGWGFNKPLSNEQKIPEKSATEGYHPWRWKPPLRPKQYSVWEPKNNTIADIFGTVVEFRSVYGHDTEIKKGVTRPIQTRHYCITIMREYQDQSLEELRLEDYIAGHEEKAEIERAYEVADRFAASSDANTTKTPVVGFGFGSGAPTSTQTSNVTFGFGFGASTSRSAAVTRSDVHRSTTSAHTSSSISKNTGAEGLPVVDRSAAPSDANTTQTPVVGSKSLFGCGHNCLNSFEPKKGFVLCVCNGEGQTRFPQSSTPSVPTMREVSTERKLGAVSPPFSQTNTSSLHSNTGTNTSFNSTNISGLECKSEANQSTVETELKTLEGRIQVNSAQKNVGANQVDPRILDKIETFEEPNKSLLEMLIELKKEVADLRGLKKHCTCEPLQTVQAELPNKKEVCDVLSGQSKLNFNHTAKHEVADLKEIKDYSTCEPLQNVEAQSTKEKEYCNVLTSQKEVIVDHIPTTGTSTVTANSISAQRQPKDNSTGLVIVSESAETPIVKEQSKGDGIIFRSLNKQTNCDGANYELKFRGTPLLVEKKTKKAVQRWCSGATTSTSRGFDFTSPTTTLNPFTTDYRAKFFEEKSTSPKLGTESSPFGQVDTINTGAGSGNNPGVNNSTSGTGVETLVGRMGVTSAEQNSGADQVDQHILDEMKNLAVLNKTILEKLNELTKEVASLRVTQEHLSCHLLPTVKAEFPNRRDSCSVLTSQEETIIDDPTAIEKIKIVTTNAISVEAQSQDSSPKPKTSHTFELPQKSFDSQFQAKSPLTTPGGSKTSKQEVTDSVDIYFDSLSVIPLPDEVDTESGEENEEILYSHKAKLSRYESNDKKWKNLGRGEIKLVKHRETDKLRLLMRRDPVLKLCLNQIITPDLNFTAKGDKTWSWYAADYSKGDISHETFACRFRTAEIAQEFKTAIDDAKALTKTPAEKASTCLSLDMEIVYEAIVSSEEKAAALKLMLPENFYAYKKMPDCPGCRGCEVDQESSSISGNTDGLITALPATE